MSQESQQERQLNISNTGEFSPALATPRERRGFLIRKTKCRGAGKTAQSTRANLRAWVQIPPLQLKNREYLWVYALSDSSIKGGRDKRVPHACWSASLANWQTSSSITIKEDTQRPYLASARLHIGHTCAHATPHTHTHMYNTHTKHTLGVKSVWKQATTGLHSLYDVSRPNHKQCVSLWIPSESTERIAGQWKAGDPTPSLKMKRKHAYFPPKQYLNCISRLVLLPCLDPCFAVNRPWDLRQLPQLDAFITRWLKGSEQKSSLNVGLPETKGNAYLKFVVE